MYAGMKVAGPSVSLYFISLVALGAFYVLNIFLAVLWETYSDSEVEAQEALAEQMEAQDAADAAERAAADERKAAYLEKQRVQARGRVGAEGDAVVSYEEVTAEQALLAEHGPDRSDRLAMRSAREAEKGSGPNPCVRFCRALSYHTGFQNFVVGLIVLNTIAMMFESYPMDPKLEERLDDLNVYLTIAFACEMLLKLGADGIEEWRRIQSLRRPRRHRQRRRPDRFLSPHRSRPQRFVLRACFGLARALVEKLAWCCRR